MTRVAHSAYATYTGDEVAERALSTLNVGRLVREYHRLTPGSRVPLGAILIVHRPDQIGYVSIEGRHTTFRVYVRESRNGKKRRCTKAIKRIPMLIEKRANGSIR